jgi:hypothetical protein
MKIFQRVRPSDSRLVRHMATAATIFAAVALLGSASFAAAPATTLHYFGKPFDSSLAIGSVPLNGPITGRIEFSVAMANGLILTQADVTDFSLNSDGLTWTPDATFKYMKIVIGPSLIPAQWEISLEQELLSGNTGVEQLVTTTPGQGHFSESFDEIVLGDGDVNTPFSGDIDGKGINVAQPGQWVIAEPAAGSMAILALIAVSGFRRMNAV